ncbi:MAG: Crp/Fnr family transcriptional regulator [Gemmatimonadota bacterium]
MPTVVDLLRNVPFLAGLDPRTLDLLASRCVPRAVGEGFTLFRAGDKCTGLYLVIEGKVRIYRTSTDGREQTLAVEGAGRPVAELPLVDGGSYPASASTLEPSRLAFLPRGDFEHAFRSDPDVATAVLTALGTRLRHFVQLVETLAFRDVAARLAMLLADYADRDGRPGDGVVRLELQRTQEELASEIGTARESVSRALKQLRVQGLVIDQEGAQLVLQPAARLRAWARGEG